jgi:hypothetical protein
MQRVHDAQGGGRGQGEVPGDIVRDEAGIALAEVLQDAAGIPQIGDDIFIGHLGYDALLRHLIHEDGENFIDARLKFTFELLIH